MGDVVVAEAAVVVEAEDGLLVAEGEDGPLVAEAEDGPLVVEDEDGPLVAEGEDGPLVAEGDADPLVAADGGGGEGAVRHGLAVEAQAVTTSGVRMAARWGCDGGSSSSEQFGNCSVGRLKPSRVAAGNCWSRRGNWR